MKLTKTWIFVALLGCVALTVVGMAGCVGTDTSATPIASEISGEINVFAAAGLQS